jgi:PAS domain S-box-containing protein
MDEATALRRIVEGTATSTGERFFEALVENLSRVLGVLGAWVTEYLPERRRLRARAFWIGGQFVEGYEYDLAGTPCESVIDDCRLVHIPERVVELYPADPDLRKYGAVSYMGMPLADPEGRILGHLAVLDDRPLAADQRALALFRIFGARAGAELQRLQAEAELRWSETRLRRLVEGAMDAILELDQRLRIQQMNPAAERLFGRAAAEARGRPLTDWLEADSQRTVRTVVETLATHPAPRSSIWLPEHLQVRTPAGTPLAADATLARVKVRGQPHYILILRDLNERLEAERRIRSLTTQSELLQEELKTALGGRLLGRSEPLAGLLEAIERVAPTDATVLILGETGTGKELVARELHARSQRCEQPLVKVNCAAIPTALMESEFFGHEKGAFTGATQKREGRFALADGGTIFLDEIGELPVDLQGKLLRVLQEGEFEPVGSSRTRKVDVRVLAATNRDLLQEVRQGRFREDLFYRLHVFPIEVPPLRQRGEDVVLLAAEFAERAARRLGRVLRPLAPAARRLLLSYAWPGNVRELQNVIERAVILSRDGELDLAALLPAGVIAGPAVAADTPAAPADRIRTDAEMQALERANLLRALEASGWKVGGAEGAARKLSVRPTTLTSRMKALGIRRPSRA